MATNSCHFSSDGPKLSSVLTLVPVCVEIWSMKEMALFQACMCEFGKRFDKFTPIVSLFWLSIFRIYPVWIILITKVQITIEINFNSWSKPIDLKFRSTILWISNQWNSLYPSNLMNFAHYGFLFCRSKQRMREKFMSFTGVGSIPSTIKHGKQRARIDQSSRLPLVTSSSMRDRFEKLESGKLLTHWASL